MSKPAPVFIHPCSVCGQTAPFGIGVALMKGRTGTWFCRAHLPESERRTWSEPLMPSLPQAGGERV